MIQFSNSVQFRCQTVLFNLIDRTLSDATTLGQSEPGRDGSEGVICISQSSSITEASPSDCSASYPVHSLVKSYPSKEMQSVYSAAPANRAIPSLKWAITLQKKPKTFVVQKVKAQLVTLQQPEGSRNFVRVTRRTLVRKA